jgi:hypothetical protein
MGALQPYRTTSMQDMGKIEAAYHPGNRVAVKEPRLRPDA